MPSPAFTEQDFADWLQHPCTQGLRAWLTGRKEQLKESWASGAFTDQSQYATAILNAKAIGACELASQVIDLDFEQLKAGEEE